MISSDLKAAISKWGGHTILLAYLLFTIIPIAWFLTASIEPPSAIQSPNPFASFTPTLQNYIDVFAKLNLMRFILNSLIICSVATLISISAGVPAAYGFARLKTKGMERLSLWILSNRMLPPIAVVIPLYLLLGQLGLLDTQIGLIIIYSAFNLPYVVWTMISFFEEIPIELDEAAALDGSSLLGILWRIMVPIATPGIIATGIFAFILCWSEFLFAVIFTSSTAQTLPVAIASFVTDRGIEWGKMSAAGSVLIVPLTVLFYSIQRFLIRGLSFGAVAG
jgi:multiple sugar transport system permease protein